MGPSSTYSRGFLFGMPSDPIEVTHAFPEYSRKFVQKSKDDEQQQLEWKQDTESFAHEHLKNVIRLRYDSANVGWYTTYNSGSRLHIEDLRDQYLRQIDDPSAICLVINLSSSSLSLRAFRVSESAMTYLQNHDLTDDDNSFIDESMLFTNIIEELEVSFTKTPLESIILSRMLSEYNLIADVFNLRDLNSFHGQLNGVADELDSINTHIQKYSSDKEKFAEDIQLRKEWKKERQETNRQRKQRGLQPLPEDVDAAIEQFVPENKKQAIFDLYSFHSTSVALKSELVEETTKITSLMALGNSQ